MLYRPSEKGEVLLQEDDTGLAPPKRHQDFYSWNQDLTVKRAGYFLDKTLLGKQLLTF